jgi:hypothetical protein
MNWDAVKDWARRRVIMLTAYPPQAETDDLQFDLRLCGWLYQTAIREIAGR